MSETPFVLYGGPYDGLRETYPGLPDSMWVGPCSCGRDRSCGGITVVSVAPTPNPRLERIVRAEGLQEYKRDRLLPDDHWRYVYADVQAGPDIFDDLLEQIARDQDHAAR